MSAQLRQCRQGLAKALGQATHHLSALNYCTHSRPERIRYVSCPVPTHHPEELHSLVLTTHNRVLTQHRADCRQKSRHGLEGFRVSGLEPEHQDLPATTDTNSMETLDELMAKLEFENELNRVCNRFSLNVTTQPEQEDSTESADSGVEEEAADGEVLDMVLDIEQDYEFFVY